MKKIMLIVVLSIFLISFTSGLIDIGTVKQKDCVELYQSCPTCNYADVRAVKYPNGTIDTSMDWTMNKNDSDYTYDFCNTSDMGIYFYTVYGNKGGLSYESTEEGTFEVTGTGFALSTSKSMIYLGLFIVIILLFLVTVGAIPMLPRGNERTPDGELISITNLKYVRSFLWVLAYLWIMLICYLGSNIAFAYLGTQLFGKLLFNVFYIMGILLFPFALIWIVYIFASIFQDRELKRLMEHGIEGAI